MLELKFCPYDGCCAIGGLNCEENCWNDCGWYDWEGGCGGALNCDEYCGAGFELNCGCSGSNQLWFDMLNCDGGCDG